ncbi:MAG: YidC/Oxa1 family membrane protein insertase [Ruminococcaceae bacterium]|nr:YidC/Oxa1 family membrane protein insertase [Oscillospiraceae bacterium]
MRTMKATPKALVRLLVLLMAVMTVLSLAGCMKQSTKIDTSFKESDTDAVVYFARVLAMDAAAKEKFVAASRGYNMSAEGFDDDNLQLDAEAIEGVSLAGAKAALEALKPEGTADKEKFVGWQSALTAAQVKEIVQKLATSVELEAKNGPIDTILIWIGKFVDILTRVTGGKYVFGLFIFAIIVEILMLPFGIKQQKTSIKQAKMRPKEMAIRKKYAGRNDQQTQQKMTQEIQKMYQEEGFNPMGGCLPLLIQLPIVMALYQIVINPLRYVIGMSAEFVTAITTYCTTAKAAGGLGMALGSGRGTIELLSSLRSEGALEGLKSFAYFTNGADVVAKMPAESALPDFNLFGLDTSLIPGFRAPWVLLVVPVLTFVVYFFSMKLTRKFSYQPQVDDPQMGCSNKVMDLMMPAMSVYITFIVPAAVGIYWIFKSIISTLKQFILHKAMPMPTFTEEDYKAAERALKGKKPEKRPAGERTTPSGKPVRSLHHIDDEDEPLPPPGQVDFEKLRREAAERKAAEEAAAAAEEAKKPEVPNLKEDRKNDENK